MTPDWLTERLAALEGVTPSPWELYHLVGGHGAWGIKREGYTWGDSAVAVGFREGTDTLPEAELIHIAAHDSDTMRQVYALLCEAYQLLHDAYDSDRFVTGEQMRELCERIERGPHGSVS